MIEKGVQVKRGIIEVGGIIIIVKQHIARIYQPTTYPTLNPCNSNNTLSPSNST